MDGARRGYELVDRAMLRLTTARPHAMKLSRTVAYAVQATLQLAQNKTGVPVPCSQLAADGRMPERFLLQILRHLVTHGILHSTRGVDGGYNLERRPEEISLLNIIEAIDGPLHSLLPSADEIPSAHEARLRQALERINATARQQLEDIKLSDLMTSGGGSSGAMARPVPSAI